MRPPRSSRQLAILGAGLCAGLVLATGLATGLTTGCAGRGKTPPRLAPRAGDLTTALRPPTRVDAIVGRTLVLPMEFAESPRGLSVSIEGGPNLPARLVRLYGEAPAPVAGWRAPDPWLGPAGDWEAIEHTGRGTTPTSGVWCAVIDIPPDPIGSFLLINGERVRCNYLPPPAAIQFAGALGDADPWRPTRPAGMAPADLFSPRFTPALRSPLDRWRWRLLHDGLRPDAPEVDPFADEVVERLARRREDLWRVALARLFVADAGLADRLKRRLAGAIDFGGTWAPAWERDEALTQRLLEDLLDPSMTAPRRGELVARWLEERPAGVVWVIDDGGTLDSARTALLPTLGIASLLDRATLSWVAPKNSGVTPDLMPLPAGGVRRLLVTPVPDESPVRTTGTLTAHLGRWSRDVTAYARPVGVAPPGLTATPFLEDWTLGAWMNSIYVPADALWTTGAMLHRPSGTPDDATPGAIRSRRWELYVECRFVPEVGDASREQVLIYAGPFGRPTSIVRVRIDGTMEHLPVPGLPAEAAEIAPPPTTVRVTRTEDRWQFRVTLAPGSVERDGLLRLGLVRTDALGRRSAWPRPMLGWEEEPARLCIDTRAWDGGASSED